MVRVRFYRPILVVRHFPLSSSAEHFIQLDVAGRQLNFDDTNKNREIAVLPGTDSIVSEIEFDEQGDGRPQIRISFYSPVEISVHQGADARSVVVFAEKVQSLNAEEADTGCH